MKRHLLLMALLGCYVLSTNAQQIPQSEKGRTHMLSPEEKNNMHLVGKSFNETPPPVGDIRNIAEFERMEGVILSYLKDFSGVGYFGIPVDLIKEMAEDALVYTLAEDDDLVEDAREVYLANGVNMDNVRFLTEEVDSYWSRDYSPWFIANNNRISVINFPYNRPRPNDDEIPVHFGEYWGADVYGMNLISTGGNYMTDGMGISASCDLVKEENPNLSNTDISNLVKDYLGVNTYHLLEDPLDDYIEHIDCWGKFLDIDKILIASVPQTDYRYADYEAIADFFKLQKTSYGNNYKVIRIFSPNGQPYTNSLILNNKVFVPIVNGWGSDWNEKALETYEEAMPGYEIIGFYDVNHAPWEGTDALHCRTHEVPDKNMLHIEHSTVFDSLPYDQNAIPVSAEVISYGAFDLTTVDLCYQINHEDFQQVSMTLLEVNDTNSSHYEFVIDDLIEGDTVSYYILAGDVSGRIENHPFIGESDPHQFYVKKDTTTTPTSIVDVLATVNLYPNPASDRLTLVYNNLESGNYSIKIIDMHGKEVFVEQMLIQEAWQRKDISLLDLPQGFYLVQISSDRYMNVEKFSIIK